MVPQESQADQQAVFDYCVANISKKPSKFADDTVIGSQFNQPLLEFSGSCAGCAETSYARLITQLFGEKMYISNATGCSSIWGGTASISPYTVNKDSGHGPAWCNSLFEDNAEHGLGLYLGQKTVRENLIKRIAEVAGSDKASAELKAAFDEFMATKNNTKANDAPAKALIAELEKAAAAGCTESAEILKSKEFIAKKSVWIFGGDGWAYDIGFGGLDHVLASGEDVNVMVFDTEMYSNTGGQASKASNIGEVCQFAAAGKEISKKSLSEIAMTYGYIYVAQIALGANMNQAVKAIAEAEAYPGPSLIIGYAPCELHGVKGGMTNCQNEMKKAVEAGYWNLFTFNPANKAQGKNPFTLTSKAVDNEKYQALLANETRYSRLTRAFPDRAKQPVRAQRAGRKRPLRAPDPPGRAVQVNQCSAGLPGSKLCCSGTSVPKGRLLRTGGYCATQQCETVNLARAQTAFDFEYKLEHALLVAKHLISNSSARTLYANRVQGRMSEIPKRPRGSLKAHPACVRSIRSACRYLAPPAA